MEKNKLLRMNNVGIVVESLDNAIAFFTEIGLTLEGRTTIAGEWAGRVTGLGDQKVEIAMMVSYARWPQPPRTFAVCKPGYYCRSPHGAGKCLRLSAGYVYR